MYTYITYISVCVLLCVHNSHVLSPLSVPYQCSPAHPSCAILSVHLPLPLPLLVLLPLPVSLQILHLCLLCYCGPSEPYECVMHCLPFICTMMFKRKERLLHTDCELKTRTVWTQYIESALGLTLVGCPCLSWSFSPPRCSLLF